eukprot:1158868-Pelagomonas_calceolata.AAC.5
MITYVCHHHQLCCNGYDCMCSHLPPQTLGTDQRTIRVDMHLLIECTYCAATGMIAYGAVIGKATPTQLVWLMVALVSVWGQQAFTKQPGEG